MTQLLLAIIYLAFISLGLPDSLLGSAWPTMYQQFGVPISYAGIISMIISAGTIVSSLQSDRLTKWLGTGKVTAISVAATAVALFGFSFSHSFWALCLWAIPYGLGAGSVDASLNNYVALHYESRHMSWLHCMWGVGATAGPYIMGIALSMGQGWNMGYRYIGIIQVVLTAILVFSIPLWKGRKSPVKNLQNTGTEQLLGNASEKAGTTSEKALSLREILKIAGAKEVMICFFCYCALEQTAGLWASSYLTLHKGVSSETAAIFASLFYIGITVGRAISGFITMKLNDTHTDGAAGTEYYCPWNNGNGASRKQCIGTGRSDSHRTGLCADLSLCHSFHTSTFWRRQIPGNHWCADGICLYWNIGDAAAVWRACQQDFCGTAAVLFICNTSCNGNHA